MSPRYLFSSFLLSFFIVSIAAHSYLTSPKPRSDQSGGCRVGHPTNLPQYDTNCPGPCENIGNIDERTTATWQRGQTVNVRWSKNNHDAGFVRWTIVKKSDMWNKGVHDRNTFAYSCWDANRGPCQGNFECGTDQERIAFSDTLEVPAIYPDGDYILGWAWFGGSGDLADYHSCANIRIQGGPQRASYTPVTKTCRSKTETVGQCPREPCNGPAPVMRKPRRFANTQTPPAVLASFFGVSTTTNNGGGSPAVQPKPSPRPPAGGSVQNAVYVLKPTNAADKCLDAGGDQNAAPVQIWSCAGTPNQKWKLEKQQDGSWVLVNQGAPGKKVLDIARGQENGNKGQLYDFWGGENQRFFIQADGGAYVLRNAYNRKALDVENLSTNNGAKVQQWDYAGTSNQKWYIQRA